MAKPKTPRNGRSHADGPSDIEKAIQTGIDALDLLRVLMRNVGMIVSADALDDAFAKCVREYIKRKEDGTIGQRPRQRRSLKKLH